MFASKTSLSIALITLTVALLPASVMAHCHDDADCERRLLLGDLISGERWDKRGPTIIDYYVNNFHVTKPSFFPDIQTGASRWNNIPRWDTPEENVNFHLQYAGSTNLLAGYRDRQSIVSWLGMQDTRIVASELPPIF